MRSIPKIIHYCWFGGNPLPADVQKYIDSWKEQMPEYEIMEWNESNYDIEKSIPYVKEAYAAKKYAFVSDYARIWALYNYGGVYFDTDVCVLKPFEDCLEDASLVTGFESDRSLLTAFIACEMKHPIIKAFLESYQDRRFVTTDGKYDMTVINVGFSRLLEKNGVDLDRDESQVVPISAGTEDVLQPIRIYPRDVFCGFDVKNWHTDMTPNTRTVHYMSGSWVDGKMTLKKKIIKLMHLIIGEKGYDSLRKFKKSLRK